MIEGTTEVSAVFAPSQYDISFQAKGGGTVNADGFPSSPAKVAYGENITFIAKADPYFFISGWEVDGVPVPDSGSQERFTLENIHAAHSVAVVFAPAVSYEVSYQAGSNGSLSATVNGQPLVLSPEQTGTANGGSKLVFTAAPSSDHMVEKWTVNGTEVTRETMASLGLTMDHHLSNVLTVSTLRGPLNVQVSFTSYQAYDLPDADNLTGCTIEDVACAPAASNNQIRHGGDLTFTVKLGDGYSTLSELTVNGYDCVAGETTSGGLQNCESVTAQKNADGSYTITVLGVNGTPQLKATAHQLMVEQGFTNYQIPESLKEKGIDTQDKLETALRAQLTAAKDGTVFYDIALKYLDSGSNTWVEVSPENFPANGVDVTLDYPSGASQQDTFSIAHMLTMGDKAGTVEQLSYTADGNGLHFHVASLSPFAVSWTKKAENPPVRPNPPGGGGGSGGGGGAASTYRITAEKSQHGKVSADMDDAAGGKTVTLTVTPDNGYVLDTLTVTDSQGNEIKLTDQGNSKYTFTMPNGAVTVKAAFVHKTCDGGADCPSRKFTDLGGVGTWYHEAVDYALRNDLMGGYGDSRFGPNNDLTRAQLAQILYNKEGKPTVTGSSVFTDVADGAWYANAVTWTATQGIVSGYGNGMFGPNDPITREQLAVMLWRYSGSPAATNKELHFNDESEINGFALEALRWAVENGIINGYGNGQLGPQGRATRAQVAQMLKNFIENQEENT